MLNYALKKGEMLCGSIFSGFCSVWGLWDRSWKLWMLILLGKGEVKCSTWYNSTRLRPNTLKFCKYNLDISFNKLLGALFAISMLYSLNVMFQCFSEENFLFWFGMCHNGHAFRVHGLWVSATLDNLWLWLDYRRECCHTQPKWVVIFRSWSSSRPLPHRSVAH